MSALTVQQRRVLRYAVTKAEGDREVRAASTSCAEPDTSSTPTLQQLVENPSVLAAAVAIGLSLLAISANGGLT
jgi:hypothetical protein